MSVSELCSVPACATMQMLIINVTGVQGGQPATVPHLQGLSAAVAMDHIHRDALVSVVSTSSIHNQLILCIGKYDSILPM